MVILKVTKKQGFTHSLEDTFLDKPQLGKLTHPRFPTSTTPPLLPPYRFSG